MADENVLAPAPTRSDDQILPFVVWVPIGKSNFVLDLQKNQKNLIFQISMDILQNTNFFRAFTTSASLDETQFVLDDNLLREALEITPIDQAHQFMSPPSGDAIMDFVNELGYTEVIHFVLRMAVNNMCQPWRAILSMINQCLTGKTSGYDRPRYPVLQMLWGIITSTNVDYAELMWEEFVQAIQTFLTDKANLGSPTKKGRKDKAHVIPYCRFTKLIICHLGRTHNIHQRSASPFHLAKEDLRLAEKGEKKKPATAKQPKPNPAKKKSSKPAPAPKPKVTKEKPSKPSPAKLPKREEGEEYDVERAIQMSLESYQAQSQSHVGGVAIREPVVEATRPLLVVEGKGKAIATEEQAAQSLLALHTPKKRIRDSPSPADAETGADTDKTNIRGDTEILQIGEEQGDDVANVVNLKEKTAEIDEGQDESDPGKTPESRPPPEQVFMDEDQAGPDPGESRVALAGPDPEPTHDEFMANVYPNVQENLKFLADEHVILEDPLSSTETLSLMNNLEDAYTIRDQFLTDKSTEDEQGKLNDLPHKINQTVNEVVKEAVHVALQAPLRDRFRDLPEADMKEMLHQWMFESGSYKSHPEHVALYEALKASMEHAQRDELLAENAKSHKRRCDYQDPPPPPPDSDPTWKTSDTREGPSSSSKQQSGLSSEQQVEDVPMPDTTHLSDSEDTDSAHLHKIKPMPEWLKPIPEDDIPETPEPDWSVPPNDLPEPENNWANALANSHKDPEENKLLRKTGDMGSFITWFCQRIC
ncbi:hypothetical protein Tco_0097628 [Tanacetum coccineum]